MNGTQNQKVLNENLQNMVARAKIVCQLSLAAVIVVWFAYILITKAI